MLRPEPPAAFSNHPPPSQRCLVLFDKEEMTTDQNHHNPIMPRASQTNHKRTWPNASSYDVWYLAVQNAGLSPFHLAVVFPLVVPLLNELLRVCQLQSKTLTPDFQLRAHSSFLFIALENRQNQNFRHYWLLLAIFITHTLSCESSPYNCTQMGPE